MTVAGSEERRRQVCEWSQVWSLRTGGGWSRGRGKQGAEEASAPWCVAAGRRVVDTGRQTKALLAMLPRPPNSSARTSLPPEADLVVLTCLNFEM